MDAPEPADEFPGIVASGSNYLPAATADAADFQADVERARQIVEGCRCFKRDCLYCEARQRREAR